MQNIDQGTSDSSEDDDEEAAHPSKRPRIESSEVSKQGALKRGGSFRDENDETTQSDLCTTDLGPHDVLIGRGVGPNENRGNVQYREAVGLFTSSYLTTERRREKDAIARKVINLIKSRGGRFMKKLSPNDSKNSDRVQYVELYAPVSSEVALSKTKQALRFHGKNSQAVSRPFDEEKKSSEMFERQHQDDQKQEDF